VVPYNTATGASALQTVKGNQLPNAPRNKIALNGNYTFVFDPGTLTLSATAIWRDEQYGAIFKEPYDVAPSWSQVDLRAVWKAPDDKYEIILYGRNVFNTEGHEAAAAGGVISTSSNVTGASTAYSQYNLYGINPPATYGIEVHYKFF
jgi:iron complex outermembrane receptor protein